MVLLILAVIMVAPPAITYADAASTTMMQKLPVFKINQLAAEQQTAAGARGAALSLLGSGGSSGSGSTTSTSAADDDENQREDEQQQDVDEDDNDDEDDSTKDVQELYLTQRLDHFASYTDDDDNGNDSNTSSSTTTGAPYSFSQRYFYTTRYLQKNQQPLHDDNVNTNHHLRGNSSPAATASESEPETYVFICIGGEGPALTKTVLTNSPHCSGDMLALATILSTERHANIHTFALEHRYYGKSYPQFTNPSATSTSPNNDDEYDQTSPVTSHNLRYLSSHQALADLATFIQHIRTNHYPTTPNSKIVVFGGSYPGMLAAWSRVKYPHLIHAAVSHSAPLQVILDFEGYMDVYANALGNPMVGGSQECVDIIQLAHDDIAGLLMGDGIRGDGDGDGDGEVTGGMDDLEYVAELFNICNGTDALQEKKNVKSFLGDGMVFFDVQGNDPACQGDLCNIEKFCGNITKSAQEKIYEPAQILARLSRAMEGGSQGQCKDISWEGMIDFLSSMDAKVGGVRSWLWQTCTEVGFYQTCNVNSTCPFARGFHVLDDDLEICQRVFGIDGSKVRENVEDTLNEYGGWNISASRILSVNGDVDPWSAQSYSNSGRKDADLPSYWSIGASHHYWTHEVKGSDGFGIMRTREIIYNWVINLLEDDPSDQGLILQQEEDDISLKGAELFDNAGLEHGKDDGGVSLTIE